MRDAKADFIRSLKDVNAADAEYKRAKAEVQRAEAAYKAAKTAWESEREKLNNEYLQLVNEAKAAQNEAEAAEIAKQIAQAELDMKAAEKQHELDMAIKEQEILDALEELRKKQRDMEFAANDLTENEKMALISAAGAYYATVEALAIQNTKIAGLEAKLEALNAKREKLVKDETMVWDKESLKYVTKIENWQNKIENAKKQIAENKAKLEAAPDPTIADIDKWAAEVKAYEDSLLKIENEVAKVKQQAAEYYGATVHEGIKKYNQAIDIWKKDHNIEGDTFEGSIASRLDTLWSKNEPKAEDYTKGYGEIEFPELAYVEDNAAYAKFWALMESYDPKFMKVGDKISINGEVDARSAYYLKDFILGDETNESLKMDTIIVENRNLKDYEGEYDSKRAVKIEKAMDTILVDYKANYGINGAIAVLERKLVITSDPNAKTPEQLKEDEDKAKAKWEADRAILLDGLTKYQPYITGIKNNTEAVEAWIKAQKSDSETADEVGAAFEAYWEVAQGLGDIALLEKSTANDIVASTLFDAMLEFAKARAKLDYAPAKDAEGKVIRDLNNFTYYTAKKEDGTLITESVKFADLKKEDVFGTKANTDYVNNPFAEEGKGKHYEFPYAALTNIATQLFGSSVMNSDYSNLTNAFYGQYTYVPEHDVTVDGKKVTVAATVKPTDKEEYKSKATQDAENVVMGYKKTAANGTSSWVRGTQDAVIDSVMKYYGVYNAFWGTDEKLGDFPKLADQVKPYELDYNLAAIAFANYFNAVNTASSKIADNKSIAEARVMGGKVGTTTYTAQLKYKATAYEAETFTNKYFVVTFNDNKEIEITQALRVILASVDPGFTNPGYVLEAEAEDIRSQSAIINERTDFYKWMKAHDAAQVFEEKDIADIKAWRDKVVAAFDAAEVAAKEKDAKFFADAKARYETAIDNIENYDTKLADWTAFVGEGYETKNDEGEIVTKQRSIKYMRKEDDAKGWFYNFNYAEMVEFASGEKIYTGAWDTTAAEGISGQLLKNAQEFLPNLPENVKAWSEIIVNASDKEAHVREIKAAAEAAYLAAAKLAGYDKDLEAENADWKHLQEAYELAQKNYVDDLKAGIDTLERKINKWSKQMASFEVDPDVTKEIDEEIVETTTEIAEAKMLIDPLTKAQELAKANYERVLDYIKAQDFTFIDFSDIFKKLGDKLDIKGILEMLGLGQYAGLLK